jgi:hypothetical protein
MIHIQKIKLCEASHPCSICKLMWYVTLWLHNFVHATHVKGVCISNQCNSSGSHTYHGGGNSNSSVIINLYLPTDLCHLKGSSCCLIAMITPLLPQGPRESAWAVVDRMHGATSLVPRPPQKNEGSLTFHVGRIRVGTRLLGISIWQECNMSQITDQILQIM